VPVSGTVTYKGTGVADVNVTFFGKDGVIGRASTDAQGRFGSVSWQKPGDGLPPGAYKVTITPKVTTPEPGSETYELQKGAPFPGKYRSSDLSDLTVNIAPGGPATVTLELKD